jgi:hypothetical protein
LADRRLLRHWKQNLRSKTFVGTSENALHIQIWTARIAILPLRYLQMRVRYGWSLSSLVALLRPQLFVCRDLQAWLDDPSTLHLPWLACTLTSWQGNFSLQFRAAQAQPESPNTPIAPTNTFFSNRTTVHSGQFAQSCGMPCPYQ